METFSLKKGNRPLLMSIPHMGTGLSEDISSLMTKEALFLPDTDWHLDRLYDFAESIDISIIKPFYSRYMIDLNRGTDNVPLYPGANNTETVPLKTFAGENIYKGKEPDTEEIKRRIETFWKPYHHALQEELSRLKEKFGKVVLFEAHSIKSVVPRLFEGKLPDFNLGTAEGKSCSPDLQEALRGVLAKSEEYTLAVNGRFKGGYITREYGKPDSGIHSFQLELCLCTYTEEKTPFEYTEDKAVKVKPYLKKMLETAVDWAEK